MRLSASRLRLWQDCPLAAWYRYGEARPTRLSSKMAFGTIVHRSLEHYNNTGDYDEAVRRFKSMWADPGSVGLEPDWWPKQWSYASLMAKGLEILANVKEHDRWQDRLVLGTEIPFLVPFGEHQLTGYIDLLDIERSGTGMELLRVIDYKTATREPSRTALALDLQFTVYLWAVSRREFWCGVPDEPDFPGLPNGEWLWETVGKMINKRAIWYGLWNQRLIDAGPRTKTDFERMYRLCCEIAKADEAGVHVPHIGEACGLCDYQEICTMEIPVAIRQLDDAGDDSRWI